MICADCGKERGIIMAVKTGFGPICAWCWYSDPSTLTSRLKGVQMNVDNALNKVLDNARLASSRTVGDEIQLACEMNGRNQRGRARWLYRRGDALLGVVLPDPRTQEQQDLGVELLCRSRIIRRIREAAS